MGAAAPARKAAPGRRRSSGGTSHSARRQQSNRSPRSAGGARHGVRATPARPKRRPAQKNRRGVRATPNRAVRGTSGPAHLVPVAVGRAGVIVRGLPDSGLVMRLTRGRAWIGLLSVLLTGIVGLNVVSLSLSASQGKISQQAQILEQENSALRARLAQRLSSERVRNAAASLGMTAPDSTDINYLDASGADVRLASRRLGDWFGTETSLVAAPTTTVIPETTTTPTTTTTTSPTATSTSTTAAPVTPTTTVSGPTTTALSTGVSAGGVAPG
jgi:hypothetical protein